MQKKIEFEWQRIDDDTSRARVIGGWLVLCRSHTKGGGITTQFISDRDHEWEIIPPFKDEKPREKVQAADFDSPAV